MEIAPVGIQMTYANANNAGQVQHNMNHAIAVQQDTEAAKQKEDAELKQAQVRNKNNADEGGTIKDDPERNARGGGYYYNRAKKRKPTSDNAPENFAMDPKRGHFLDISM